MFSSLMSCISCKLVCLLTSYSKTKNNGSTFLQNVWSYCTLVIMYISCVFHTFHFISKIGVLLNSVEVYIYFHNIEVMNNLHSSVSCFIPSTFIRLSIWKRTQTGPSIIKNCDSFSFLYCYIYNPSQKMPLL